MSKRSKKIVAIILLVAFAAWMIFTVFPFGGAENPVPKSGNNALKEYEPTFRKEGELYFVKESDTIKKIDIELAETQEEISYGMMYRKSMDLNTGMLFLMPGESRQSFYMKNTYVPLDIIFINKAGEVVSIQKNAEPLNTRSLPSEGPASLVLEVYGGFSDKNNITPGTKIFYERVQ